MLDIEQPLRRGYRLARPLFNIVRTAVLPVRVMLFNADEGSVRAWRTSYDIRRKFANATSYGPAISTSMTNFE